MIIHNDIDQKSDEWLKLRAGKFTASKDFQQVVTGKKDTYKRLTRLKAAEKLTGALCLSDYKNEHIERGNKLEDLAIKEFEVMNDIIVKRVGFVELNEWVGCSPDGLIGDDGGIEIKCKDIHTHLDCWIDGYDTKYKYQIQGNLWVTNRKYWYFVSYNPHYINIDKHLYIEKIERDEELIESIKNNTEKAIEDVKQIIREQG